MRKEIAIIGTINPEIITGPISSLPEWGTQAVTPGTEIVYAGSAARVAFPLRALGHEVAVFGVVGRDDFGSRCLAELQSWGIDASGVEQIDGERTASCIAIVREDAQRFYLSEIGVLHRCDDAYLCRHLDCLAGFDFVLLTGLFEIRGLSAHGVQDVYSYLRAQKVTTLLDTGWHLGGWDAGTLSELYSLLRETDYVLPNMDEIIRMAGTEGGPETLLRKLRHMGANDIYLKLGHQGAACLASDEYFAVKGIPIVPTNTTAAGECFNAGVLHGLAVGMTPVEVLDFANRLSAHYVATGRYRAMEA